MVPARKTADRLKSKARAKWQKLTDEDLDAIKDDVVELATRLQARYEITAEEAKKQAEEFVDAASDTYDVAIGRLDATVRQVEQAVRRNAWESLGSALLLGIVIGFVIGHDQRRSRW
jgi:ElaB/YqjD/DUF883 family membrane-anchored ribosome-binding protein